MHRPEPATAIGAATSAVDALITLADSCSQPGQPLAAHAATLRTLLDVARIMADLLPIEARIAARVLTPAVHDSDNTEPADAGRARRKLQRAGMLIHAAADNLYRAWQETQRMARDTESDDADGRPLQLARIARRRIADLDDALTAAEYQRVTPTLAMMAGHQQIAEALTIAASHLSRACNQLRAPVSDAFGPAAARTGATGRRRAALAASALFHAAIRFADARLQLADAQRTLTDGWEQRRTLEGRVA
jgi:hypothetical protein